MLVAEEGITFDEANALIETAGKVGRQPLRDQCLLRLIYRHGLRASEARDAKWTDFDIMAGSGSKTFHVRRLKGSVGSVHTLDRDCAVAFRTAEGQRPPNRDVETLRQSLPGSSLRTVG
jgi:integrase